MKNSGIRAPVVAKTIQATSHRLFFALVPDPATCRKIEILQRQLDPGCGIGGRAVTASQYHETLAFLGMQSNARLPLLLALASGLDMPACSVVLDCLGSFPRAGVVWLGATKLPSELCAFQARLITELERAQITFDRKPWTFHLTLYRNLRKPYLTMDPGTVRWSLDGFSLVESISTGRGVEYRPLGRWKAGSSDNTQQNV
jgi:2'-5' RNA ligase